MLYLKNKKWGSTSKYHPTKYKQLKFIEMTKQIKLSPVSKRNGVKNDLHFY